MVNNLNIGVNFTGNLGNLPGLTQQAATGLTSVGNAANAAAAGLGNASTAATAAGRGLNGLAPLIRPSLQGLTLLGRAGATAAQGINQAATAAQTLVPGASQATYAITQFGRGVQDAPFGLIGFANNIEGVVTGFISVFRTAGGAAAGFRAVGASLIGPGGLILGISLLSTAITLAGQGLFSFGGAAEGLSKALKDSNEEAGKEIAQLKILATVASDTTRSTTERKNAAADLQKQLKENNVTLSQEAILNDQAASAINLATKAILERAKARAIENRIAELTAKNLERDLQRPDLAKRRLDTQKQLNAERAKESRIAGAPSTVRPETIGLATAARDALIELDQATLDANKEINDLLKLVNDEDITPKFDDFKFKKGTDLLKQRIDALKSLRDSVGLSTVQQRELVRLEVQLLNRDGVKLGFTPQEVQDRIRDLIESTRFGREGAGIQVSVPLVVIPRPIIDVQGETGTDQIAEDYADRLVNSINKKTNEAFKAELDFGPTIANVLSDSISAIGEGGDIFGAIFQSIGAGLKSLGSALIAYGVAAEAFKKTFSNPFAAIAAGAGLILAGSLLQKAIPQFADGVRGFAGGVAIVGERGPELVNLPSGSDVIPNHMLGVGGQSLQVFGVIRGEDIYLSNNRVTQRRRRI